MRSTLLLIMLAIALLTGINAEGAWSMFPMPYEKGARMVFFNQNKEDVVLNVKMNIEERKSLQANVGRFHATFTEVQSYDKNYDSLPRFGKSPKPFHLTLQTNRGPGKYVGTMVHVDWPHREIWWWPQEIMKSIYGSTAFWYANPPQDTGSDQNLAYLRLIHHGNIKGENGVWEDEISKSK